MRPRTAGYFAMMLAVMVVGCGTMANLEGLDSPLQRSPSVPPPPPSPFGGVARDAKWISGTVTSFSESHGTSLLLSPIFVADIPCSLVGDIVTLPKVLIDAKNYRSPFADAASSPAWKPAPTAQQTAEPSGSPSR
jgi:hypothetical protein